MSLLDSNRRQDTPLHHDCEPPVAWWGYRDYFECAKALGDNYKRAACVSRAFRSLPDGEFRIAIAAPIFADAQDPNSDWIGILVATKKLGAALIGVDFTNRPETTTTTVLGMRDIDHDVVAKQLAEAHQLEPRCDAPGGSASDVDSRPNYTFNRGRE